MGLPLGLEVNHPGGFSPSGFHLLVTVVPETGLKSKLALWVNSGPRPGSDSANRVQVQIHCCV